MYRHFPNLLTVLRLVLAALFFLVLNAYRYPTDPGEWTYLFGAMALFILAAITDALDGYLARRWHAESAFGRIMDPFCDKILIIGAFIYLSGPRFVIHDQPAHFLRLQLDMVSGIYPWMVVVMLAREMLVTDLRGGLEDQGVQFPAKLSGKLKMILQSIGVPVILLIVWLDPRQQGHEWMAWVRDLFVYAIVLVTAASGLPYITGAAKALRKHK